MMPHGRLFDVAKVVQDAVEDYYAAQFVLLPDRRYVAPGAPAMDCEQLTVHIERVFTNEGDVTFETAQPLRRAPGHGLPAATVIVSLYRCTPVQDDNGNPPSAAALELNAQELLADGIMLHNALLVADDASRLGFNLLALNGWTNIEPIGAFGGGYLRATLGLQRAPGGS